MNTSIIIELEGLTKKIEHNSATLDDYKRYELLLLNGGLSHNYIFSYLKRAGFNSWDDFVKARISKEKDVDASLIGTIIGLGLGLLLLSALFDNKK